jgi:prepilin peptidase CpaA
MALDLIRLFLFPAVMVLAAVSDLFTMKISNRISLSLLAGFVLLAAFGGMSLHAISMHVAAGFAVLTVAFACFAFGWIGGGDAKLVAATALWFGFDHLLVYLVYAAVVGGTLALLLLSFRNWPLPVALLSQDWAQRLHDRKSGIPYGVALAIAALLIYPESEWMKAIDFSRFG